MDFLDKIRPLLTDLAIQEVGRLAAPECLDNFRTVLTMVAPMLDGIHAVFCVAGESAFPVLKEQLFRENQQNLTKLKLLQINFDSGFFLLHIKKKERKQNS